MQFNDTSTSLGLIQDIDFILNLDTATTYSTANKTRCINAWYERAVSLILQADQRWEFDDNNATDLPIATTSLVADQQDYAITGATFLKVLRVEIKNESGNWIQLKQMSMQDKKGTAMTEYRKTAGTPDEYDLLGQSIFLYPKPDYSASASLKVYYQRNVSLFAATDTTKVPGFAAPFHRLLSFGAAYDYCIANALTSRIPLLQTEIQKLENGLMEFYANRDRDKKIWMTINSEDYGQEEYQGNASVDFN